MFDHSKNSVRIFFSSHRTEILIFCLVFGIRLAYFFLVLSLAGVKGFVAHSDAQVFVETARNFLSYHTLSDDPALPMIPGSLRTPLYPLFISPFLWFRLSLFWVVLAQNILAGLVPVMIYKIGETVLKSKKASLLAAILVGFEPISIYWNGLLMSDNLFVFLFILALFLFVRQKIYLFAVSLGLAVLTRPVGLYLFPVFLIMFVFQHSRKVSGEQENKKFFWGKRLALAMLLFLLILSPWIVRNKVTFNTWELSSAGWLNLYIFNFANFAREQGFTLLPPPNTSNYYDFSNVPFYKNQIFKIVSERPLSYIKYHLGFLAKTFNYHGYSYLMDYVIRVKIPQVSKQTGQLAVGFGRWLWLALYVFIIIGFLRGENRRWQAFLITLVLTHNLLLGQSGVTQGGRYTMPTDPILLLLGSYGIFRVKDFLFCNKKEICKHPIGT